MKNVILLVGISLGILAMSCHDITVGYLSTENAGYEPDSMVVRQILQVDSTKNPKWDTYLNIVQGFWSILGYPSPEKCVEDLYGIKEWDYEVDYDRERLQLPWLSTKIQGVNGTQQIHVQVKGIKSNDGDSNAMSELLTVRGDGMLKLPTDISSIPVGRYVISLNIYNEGYSQNVDDCFTIIVE